MKVKILVFIIILSLTSNLIQAQTELITNGSFASGSTGWTMYGNFYADSRFSYCRSCPGYAYLSNADGSHGNNLFGSMSQTISIPSNITSAVLTFWYYITTDELISKSYDFLTITIQDANGNYLSTVAILSNLDKTTTYTKISYDLTSFKGQTIRISFVGTTDSTYPTSFRIDDVSIITTQIITSPPNISSIVPSSYEASYDNSQMTIYGNNFQNNCTLTFIPPEGGTISSRPEKLTFVSSMQINYLFNNGNDVGTWFVRVNNPDGKSSDYFSFSVISSIPQPVTSVVEGIDVSKFQGDINWNQVFNQGGKKFAIIRATAGKRTTDDKFLKNIVEAKNAGLIVGAYHFAYPQAYTAHEEAQKFLSVASNYIGNGYLPPALDIEDSPDEESFPYQMGKATLSQWIRDWCSEVEQAAHKKPIIYCTRYYARNYLENTINQYPYWVVTDGGSPNYDPGNMGIWSNWKFQQYRYGESGGTCPGINGPVSLDSFNGSYNDLLNIILALTPPDVSGYSLMQNYPNPFNSFTIIAYSVPQPKFVKIALYDVWGREVMLLVNEQKQPGSYEIQLNADQLQNGIYFYKMFAGEFSDAKKLIVNK